MATWFDRNGNKMDAKYEFCKDCKLVCKTNPENIEMLEGALYMQMEDSMYHVGVPYEGCKPFDMKYYDKIREDWEKECGGSKCFDCAIRVWNDMMHRDGYSDPQYYN